MPRLTFYTPFPDVRNQPPRLYKYLVEQARDNSTSLVGLPLSYDSKARAATYDGYLHHVEELERFKAVHIHKFKQELAAKEEDVQVVPLDYPTESGKQIFTDYTMDDILFVHCHGNTSVIGTGGFILTPEMLALNMEALGLSKDNPPRVVVWSCNSGKEDAEFDGTSYADRFREALKKLGYKNLVVVGIPATIVINGVNANTPVTYLRKELLYGKERQIPVPPNQAVNMYMSPDPRNAFDLEKAAKDKLLTQLKKAKQAKKSTLSVGKMDLEAIEDTTASSSAAAAPAATNKVERRKTRRTQDLTERETDEPIQERVHRTRSVLFSPPPEAPSEPSYQKATKSSAAKERERAPSTDDRPPWIPTGNTFADSSFNAHVRPQRPHRH